VKSRRTEDFLAAYAKLPRRVQRSATKSYRLWLRNRAPPSLDFKRVGHRTAVYSVRIAIGWRALGVLDGDTVIWFWIGSHAEYDSIVRRLT
jgi:hypothetical protein